MTVQNPTFTAIGATLCTCSNHAQVGARTGFAQQLAPQMVALQRWRNVRCSNRIAGVCHDRGNHHAQTHIEKAGGHVVAAFFLTPNELLHGRTASAAQSNRPSDGAKTCRSFFGLPITCGLHALCRRKVRCKVVVGSGLEGGIDIQPCAALGAETGLGGGIVEVHGAIRNRSTQVGCSGRVHFVFELLDHDFAPCMHIAQHDGQAARSAVMQVAIQFPGVAHAAMHLNAFLCGHAVGLTGRHASTGCCQGQFRCGLFAVCIGRQGPCTVVTMCPGQLVGRVDVCQLVLDALVRPNRAAKCFALTRVGG